MPLETVFEQLEAPAERISLWRENGGQPFLTVLHDPGAPAAKRFRMWYNVDVVDDPADGAFFGAIQGGDQTNG